MSSKYLLNLFQIVYVSTVNDTFPISNYKLLSSAFISHVLFIFGTFLKIISAYIAILKFTFQLCPKPSPPSPSNFQHIHTPKHINTHPQQYKFVYPTYLFLLKGDFGISATGIICSPGRTHMIGPSSLSFRLSNFRLDSVPHGSVH